MYVKICFFTERLASASRRGEVSSSCPRLEGVWGMTPASLVPFLFPVNSDNTDLWTPNPERHISRFDMWVFSLSPGSSPGFDSIPVPSGSGFCKDVGSGGEFIVAYGVKGGEDDG